MHYRGCIQVPMVIVDPSRAPARTSSLVSSIDMAPTLNDLCDIDGYSGIQGVSQTAVFDDRPRPVPQHRRRLGGAILTQSTRAPWTAELTAA